MTPKNSRALEWLVWGVLGSIILVIVFAFLLSKPKLKNSPVKSLPVYGKVADFNLTNHLSQPVSLGDLKEKVWLANLIFTRCPGPCAKLSAKMATLQKDLAEFSTVRLITLTADPEFDTPAILKKYSRIYEADEKQWWFLTGKKSELYHLATTNGLMLIAVETTPDRRASENDLFTHSTSIVLVDQKGRLRGHFDSERPDLNPSIRAAVQALLKEEER